MACLGLELLEVVAHRDVVQRHEGAPGREAEEGLEPRVLLRGLQERGARRERAGRVVRVQRVPALNCRLNGRAHKPASTEDWTLRR